LAPRATGTSFWPSTFDLGKAVHCVVTARNPYGESSMPSAAMIIRPPTLSTPAAAERQ
jgi:hypothetical protein